MRKRLWVIIIARLAILLLFSAAAAALTFALSVDLVSSLVTATAAVGVLSAGYALLARFAPRHELQSFCQLMVDVLVVSWLVYQTGDAASPLTPLYLVIISAASTVLDERRVYAIASASALLFGGLAAAAVNGLVGRGTNVFASGEISHDEVIYKVVLSLVAFFVVAGLSSHLASRLRGSATQLAETAQSLSALRAFNERVIDSISSGLVTVDLAGRIKTFNRAAEEITGFKFTDVYAQPLKELFGNIGAQVRASLAENRRGVRVSRFEHDCRTATGKLLHLGFSASPLMAEGGGHTGVVISFQDLTEVNKLERELRRRDRLVALGRVAAGIAHEVRNPLASMRGAVQVLQSELELTEEQAALMSIVLRESDRLNGIVTDFLNYARPAAPAKQPLELREVLAEMLRLLRHGTELTERHRLVEDFSPDPVHVEADPNQLRQVCWNLTRNALQAMPDGGALTIRLGRTGGAVWLTFEDTGCGMGEDQLERLFEPFNSTKSSGTGLGLAIVHQVVSDHGGSIAVESAVGRGTKILITLPCFTENRLGGEEENAVWDLAAYEASQPVSVVAGPIGGADGYA